MKNIILKQFKIILLTAVFIFVTDCGKRDRNPDVLRFAMSADIRGFDPAFATDIRTGKMMTLVYDNLVQFGDNTEVIPGIAYKWNLDETGKIYTFYLEPSAAFHEGSKVTAGDVIFSFQRVLSPEIGSPQSWLFNKIDGAEAYMKGAETFVRGLTKINDSTLVITLNEPFAPFIQYLAMPSASIVNAKHEDSIKEIPAGSGPWILDNWQRDAAISFRKNDNYWGRKPKTEQLSFRILSESLSRMGEFEAGNLDIVDIPDIELTRWKNQKHWDGSVVGKDELNIWYIGMNCSRPPFNDRRLRLAMSLAIDREKILSILLSESGTLAEGPVPPQLMQSLQNDPIPFDPEEAMRLLKSSGYEHGIQTELWVAGGSEMFHVLEAFQSYWSAVGISVTIMRSDWNVFKTAVREGKPDLYYLDWFADYPDGENFLYPLFHSKESMTKRNRYSNPAVDRNIETIQRLRNGKERNDLIKETHRLIKDDAPWVFLWHGRTHTAVHPWIEGYKPKLIFNAERYLEMHHMPL